MQKLIFKNSGPIDNFITWIERFKGDISANSLVIEIDPVKEMFISKTYAGDHSLVRYSQISFKDANLQVTSKKLSIEGQPDAELSERVFIGIYAILPKFIEVLKTLATSKSFDLTVNYGFADVKGKQMLCAESVCFKSKSLKMKVPGSSIEVINLIPMPDDIFFNKVWVAPDPVSITLSADLIKNIISISDIFAVSDKTKNFMEFYTKTEDVDGVETKVIYCKDPVNESYDYLIGPTTEPTELQKDFRIKVYRYKFLLAVSNAIDETTMTVSSSATSRLLIDLKGGNTKTIIAGIKD